MLYVVSLLQCNEHKTRLSAPCVPVPGHAFCYIPPTMVFGSLGAIVVNRASYCKYRITSVIPSPALSTDVLLLLLCVISEPQAQTNAAHCVLRTRVQVCSMRAQRNNTNLRIHNICTRFRVRYYSAIRRLKAGETRVLTAAVCAVGSHKKVLFGLQMWEIWRENVYIYIHIYTYICVCFDVACDDFTTTASSSSNSTAVTAWLWGVLHVTIICWCCHPTINVRSMSLNAADNSKTFLREEKNHRKHRKPIY